jgi:hypothetical protein
MEILEKNRARLLNEDHKVVDLFVDKGTKEKDVPETHVREEMEYRWFFRIKLKPPGQQLYLVYGDNEPLFWKLWNISMLSLACYTYISLVVTAMMVAIDREFGDTAGYMSGHGKHDYFHLFTPPEENGMAHAANALRCVHNACVWETDSYWYVLSL